MGTPKVKVTKNIGAVRALFDQAKVATQDKLADRGAMYARQDAPKDTGFYSENIVALTSASTGSGAISELRTDKQGRKVKRSTTDTSGTKVGYSAVVAKAAYSIYVEMRYFTIANAVSRASSDFGEIIDEVRQQIFGS